MTSMACNTPLVTETVLKKEFPSLLLNRKPKIIKPRAKDVLKETGPVEKIILQQLSNTPGTIVYSIIKS